MVMFVGTVSQPNQLTTVLFESAEGEKKECGQTKYPTQDLWLLSQMHYRLPNGPGLSPCLLVM